MIAELSNHLWQSTLYAGAVWALAIMLRANRPQVRFWLWLSASLKFLIPFALLVNIGSRIEWAPGGAAMAPPAITFAIQQVAQPFTVPVPAVDPAQAPVNWIPIAIGIAWAAGFVTVAVLRLREWLRIRTIMRAGSRLDFDVPIPVVS